MTVMKLKMKLLAELARNSQIKIDNEINFYCFAVFTDNFRMLINNADQWNQTYAYVI